METKKNLKSNKKKEITYKRKIELAINHREQETMVLKEPESMNNKVSDDIKPEVTDPIILWWTDGSDQPDVYRDVGGDRCFVTGNRNHTNSPLTKVCKITIYSFLKQVETFCCYLGQSVTHIFIRISQRTKAKLHDLALSMGENKALNLKDKTLLKLYARHHVILISISSFVLETTRA
jgi:hypothetical protein